MSKYTAFRCPNDLLKRAKAIADGDRRSLSNYIIRLMEEDAVRRAARQMRLNEKETGEHLYSGAYSA